MILFLGERDNISQAFSVGPISQKKTKKQRLQYQLAVNRAARARAIEN